MGSTVGCKRGKNWCAHALWDTVLVPGDDEGMVEKKVMTCLLGMNHFPTKDIPTGSTFTPGGDGPWCTGIESYGSTTDSMAEGVHRYANHDVQGRYETGLEEYIPGDIDDLDDLDVMVEEALSNISDSAVRQCVEDMVYSGKMRIVGADDEGIFGTDEDGLARHVIEVERRYTAGISCPYWTHGSLYDVEHMRVIEVMIDGLIEHEERDKLDKTMALIRKNWKEGRGNFAVMKGCPEERRVWVRIQHKMIEFKYAGLSWIRE